MVECLIMPNDDGSDDSLVVAEHTRVDGVEGVSLCWSKAGTFLSNKDVKQLHEWLNKRSREQQHAKTTEWVKNHLSKSSNCEDLEILVDQAGLSSYDDIDPDGRFKEEQDFGYSDSDFGAK